MKNKLLSGKPYFSIKLLKGLQGIFFKTMLSTEVPSDPKLCTQNSKCWTKAMSAKTQATDVIHTMLWD